MGAKWLYQLRSAPGQQTSTLHLFHRFEALGAKKVCKWSTQTTLCEFPLQSAETAGAPARLCLMMSLCSSSRPPAGKRHPPPQVAGGAIRMDKTAQDVFIVNFATDCPNKVCFFSSPPLLTSVRHAPLYVHITSTVLTDESPGPRRWLMLRI